MHSRGFTLLELSIVLVIIGLLAGGVVVGQNLIRAAEIRSVANDLERYQTALYSFRTKYMALPGDMHNATKFWGAAHADPDTCKTTASTDKKTCNGNGDGFVDKETVVGSDDYEMFRFWQHLANAGLVEGTFTGVEGPGGTEHHLVGTNCPEARVSGVGYSFAYNTPPPPTWYPTSTGHTFVIGREDTKHNLYEPYLPAFTTEEAYSIDLKIDDGRPGLGKLHAQKSSVLPCTTTDNPLTAEYDLANEDVVCSLVFLFE